jgi:hypothetical protein
MTVSASAELLQWTIATVIALCGVALQLINEKRGGLAAEAPQERPKRGNVRPE